MRISKPGLTKKLVRQYRDILGGGCDPSYPSWRFPQAAPWSAFFFAKRWCGRDIDLKALARIVLRSENPECAYRFAREVPGANVRKFQLVVVRNGGPGLMRRFAREVPGADAPWLEQMAIVAEIMVL